MGQHMYDQNTRHRAVIHYTYFLRSIRKVSKIYNVGKSTLSRWLRLSHVPTERKKRPSLAHRLAPRVSGYLKDDPFMTLQEIVQRLKDSDHAASTTTVHRAIRTARFSRKRVQPRFQPRKPTTEQAVEFLKNFDAAQEIISIDETCVYANDSPRYGYTLRGTRCCHCTKAPKRTGKLTLVLAISNKRGCIAHKLVKGSFNSESFRCFLGSVPAKKGNVVLMDNVAFHHSKCVLSELKGRGLRTLFTPPYCPEFNPIEMAFGVLKGIMRRRSHDAMESTLNRITPEICASWFAKSRRFVVGVTEEKS
jgi:transposase